METSAKTGRNIDVLFSTLFETANLPVEMSLEVKEKRKNVIPLATVMSLGKLLVNIEDCVKCPFMIYCRTVDLI